MTLHEIMQGFSISECRWLEPDGAKPGARVSVGDALKRKEILSEFIFWLFDGFIVPLIKVRP